MFFRLLPLALAGLATAAEAHVTLERPQATAGAAYKAVLRVPHGCGASPTTGLRVTLPEGLFAARPQPKPGWQVGTVSGAYQRAYSLHGREMREGVREIAWSGGSLASEHYDEFVFIGQVDGAVTGDLRLSVVQTCAEGEARWEAPLRILAASGERPAASVTRGDLVIAQPWSRATPAGARVAGGYLTVTNRGGQPDRLVSGTADFAERVEIHEMAVNNGVMTMRGLADGLVIQPGQTVELKPGGYHIMFMGLKEQMVEGRTVKVRLTFERAGTVELDFRIGGIAGRAAPGGDHSHH